MTTLLLLAAAATAEIKVTELREPSPFVVVQAYLKAPEMTERETAAWQVLGKVLLQGTIEYSSNTIRKFGSQAGVPPKIVTMPDYLRLQIVLPKSGLSLAGDFVFAILTRPALRDQDVALAIEQLKAEESKPWIAAMTGVSYRYDRLRKGDVRRIWERALRPENLSFVVGGGIEPGQGKEELASRFERWSPVRDIGSPRPNSPARPLLSVAGPVSTFMITGQPLTPASSSSAARLLAVFALGVGKQGALHRVLREEMGLSYLQQAVLWPTNKGWSPRLFMVRKTEDGEAKYAAIMRDALLKDIESWDEGTVLRAQAMAKAAFTRNLAGSPIWLDHEGPMAQSLADRCAWRGYLEMVGSGALREEVLLGAMQNVDLDQLKEQATAYLDQANIGWLPGRR